MSDRPVSDRPLRIELYQLIGTPHDQLLQGLANITRLLAALARAHGIPVENVEDNEDTDDLSPSRPHDRS